MLYEYKKESIGRIMSKEPTNKDWCLRKNDYLQTCIQGFKPGQIHSAVTSYTDFWVYKATKNFMNSEEYVDNKIVLLELSRKTIQNSIIQQYKKTYLKCLITNPYLTNGKISTEWVCLDWLMPLSSITTEKLKKELLQELKK